MGAWGPAIYASDFASDLKNSISLLTKIPVSGDRLLELLLDQQDGEPALDDADGTAFWIVVADQFERRGIQCDRCFERVQFAIESGADLKNLADLGLDKKALLKREKILNELLLRIQLPRPVRVIPETPKLPDAIFKAGQIYTFPTRDGKSVSAWLSESEVCNFPPMAGGR